jgi:hypothetical protein
MTKVSHSDWTSPGGEPNGYGLVYFEDIILRNGPAEDIYYDGSVYLDEDPFVNGYNNRPLLLKQDCRLINAGGEYIDELQYLIGKTTAWEGTPDNNVVDIGFHYFNWYYVNAWDWNCSFADMDDNMTVDLRDFAILADSWQETYDINDLKIMADKWLWTESTFPNIVTSFDGEPNNLSGYAQMSITVPDPNIYRVFALIDGKLYDEIWLPGDFESPTRGIQTEYFSNGSHYIKIVSVNYDLNVICSQVNEVIFNNEISNIGISEGYQLSKPFYFYAFGPSSANYVVDVEDQIEDTTVYSENFTGNIQAAIPAEDFNNDSQFYKLIVKDLSGNVKFGEFFGRDYEADEFEEESSSGVATSSIGDPNTYKMIISIGSWDLERDCNAVISEIVERSRTKFGIDTKSVMLLTYRQSGWGHVKYRLQSLPNVKIWFHFGHGGYPILNQSIEFRGGLSVSAFRSWWHDHSMTELDFQESHKLNFVFFHSCYGARTTQFPEALGIHPIPLEEMPGERAFISWKDKAFKGDWIKQYNSYLIILFQQMIACGANLRDAKAETEDPIHGIKDVDEISLNLTLYGVASDQFVYFSYPDINP